MNTEDRDFVYLAKTFDAPALDTGEFVDEMTEGVLPVWRRLFEKKQLVSVQFLQKIGDVDLQTSSEPVRDWGYFALLELAPGVALASVLAAEDERTRGEALQARGIQYLSSEVFVRPAAAGTAIPLPSPFWPVPPPHHTAAIEYIQIPDSYWVEYRRFMRDVMGPVGARLVELGYSYQVQILERERVLHRHASLPPWNRVHILWGEFDDASAGFFKHSTEAIRTVVGPEYDVHSALNLVNGYRIKPRMSRNRRLEALCIDRHMPIT